MLSSSPKSPVLSTLRTEGVKLDGIDVVLREPTRENGDALVEEKSELYTTTASIHRHSDIEKGVSRTQFNWVRDILL